MTAGLQVLNDSGVLQIDETYRNMVVRSHSTFATLGDHTVSLNPGVSPLVAIRSVAAPGMFVKSATLAGSSWSWVVNGIGDVYIFDVPPAPSLHGQGLQVFDGAGNISFDSGYDYLKPKFVSIFQPIVSLGDGGAAQTFPNVVPGRVEGGTDGPLIQPSGKTWAYIMGDNGGWIRYSEGGDGIERWGLWGIYTSGSNFKVVRVQLGTGTTVPADSSGFLAGIFVDVTGVP